MTTQTETNQNTTNTSESSLLFNLDDKPPLLIALLTGFQHFIGMFVSIMTAPLIICLGLGMPIEDINLIISSSLLISGIATIIQVTRIGPLGSGLLAVQGTSYAFIGTIIVAGSTLQSTMPQTEMLGKLFGTMAVGACCLMLMSCFVQYLKPFFTTTVAGVAVILLGIFLVFTTAENMIRDYAQIKQQGGSTMTFLLLAVAIAVIIFIFTRSQNKWIRLSSISLGLAIGYMVALILGEVDFSPISDLPSIFIPQVLKYPIGFDWGLFIALLPVYLATMAESIGDLTATSSLSKQPIVGRSYWSRVRGGLLAEGFSSVFAALLNTFPLTTFSQNNGVIRLTGVASRYVGIFIGLFLILFALFPIIGGLLQVMPKAILHGATGLMFLMIVISGIRIISISVQAKRSWVIAGIAIVVSILLSILSRVLEMNPQMQLFLGFPVALGTLLAIILEQVIPAQTVQELT